MDGDDYHDLKRENCEFKSVKAQGAQGYSGQHERVGVANTCRGLEANSKRIRWCG